MRRECKDDNHFNSLIPYLDYNVRVVEDTLKFDFENFEPLK
jgi:hypothetical protein